MHLVGLLKRLPVSQMRRVVRFAVRRGKRVIGWLYIYLIVVPYLTYKENLDRPIAISTTFKSTVVMDNSNCYKVATGTSSTIGLEFENYVQACRSHSALSDLLPDYKYERGALVRYLSAARYNSVDLSSAVEFAVRLHRIIQSSNTPGARPGIDEFSELVAGLEIIDRCYSSPAVNKLRQEVERFLQQGNYHVGFAHGDFHSGNILVDRSGNPRLIDLDCVRHSGIQEFDPLYFLVEYQRSVTGVPWFQTIARYLNGGLSAEEASLLARFGVEFDRSLAVAYFVDRVGQEYRNYGYVYQKNRLAPVLDRINDVKP